MTTYEKKLMEEFDKAFVEALKNGQTLQKLFEAIKADLKMLGFE